MNVGSKLISFNDIKTDIDYENLYLQDILLETFLKESFLIKILKKLLE